MSTRCFSKSKRFSSRPHDEQALYSSNLSKQMRKLPFLQGPEPHILFTCQVSPCFLVPTWTKHRPGAGPTKVPLPEAESNGK